MLREQIIATACICLFIFIPGLILHLNGVIDPYNLLTAVSVELSLKQGVMTPVSIGNYYSDPREMGFLGYPIILGILVIVTNLDIMRLLTLPIGCLMVPFVYFALIYRLFDSKILALCFAIYMGFDPSLAPGHYNVFAYTWDRTLLFAFFICFIEILSGKKSSQTFKILLMVIFIGTYNIYWTTPFLMIIFLVVANILYYTNFRNINGANKTINIQSLLMCIVIVLFFNNVIYAEFIPSVLDEKYGTYDDAITKLSKWIPFKTARTDEISTVTASNDTSSYELILILRYVTILIPIIAYMLLTIIKYIKDGAFGHRVDSYSYLMWGILVSAVLQTIGYSLRGHLSLRYICILFPILAMICLIRMNTKKIFINIYLLMLVALTITGFSYLALDEFSSLNKSKNSEIGLKFLLNTSSEDPAFITEINTYGMYLLLSAKENKNVYMYRYTNEIYDAVINPNSRHAVKLSSQADYITINRNNIRSPISVGGWRSYEALNIHVANITNNGKLNKIYDDSIIWHYEIK